MEKEIMQSTVPGTRMQVTPKMRWIDDMDVVFLRCRLKN